MGYIDDNLLPGEGVVKRAVMHWAIYVPGIVLLPLFGIGLILLLAAWIESITTELAVTSMRVIAKKGLISRLTMELNLSKVESIGVDQSILGRILGYGTVTVVGTGGTREPFKTIAAPLEFRRAVQALSHSQAEYIKPSPDPLG
jgi:uncharacterized membrane protein YdbT with pleckstrin-like domain